MWNKDQSDVVAAFIHLICSLYPIIYCVLVNLNLVTCLTCSVNHIYMMYFGKRSDKNCFTLRNNSKFSSGPIFGLGVPWVGLI